MNNIKTWRERAEDEKGSWPAFANVPESLPWSDIARNMQKEIAELRAALQAQQGEDATPRMSTDLLNRIAPRHLDYSLDAYWQAPSGVGPLAKQWENKPHRLVYDLIAALMQQGEAKDAPAG